MEEETKSLQILIYEDWECYLFGMHTGLVVRPLKGELPNWFWRKMQYLFFGNIWKEIVTNPTQVEKE